PTGGQATVFYDPANPPDAVLQTGLNGQSLFMLLFLTPFNLVMLAIWLVPLAWLAGRNRSGVAGGVPVIQEPMRMRTRARLPRWPPVAAAGVTLLATSFASIFILGFVSGFDPSIEAVVATWVAIIALSAAVFTRRWLKVQSGSEDLVIDLGARTLTLPQTFG